MPAPPMHTLIALPCVMSVLICLAASARAQNGAVREETDDRSIVTVVWENDVFSGTDNNYTNGIRFAWLSSEHGAPDWVQQASRTLLPLDSEGNKRVSFSLGQSMFTPDNLRERALIRNDRPYGGWLYASFGLLSDTGETLDNLLITAGVVGSPSLARQTQRLVHRLIDSPRPNGWHNQLETEPGLIVTYERKWRSWQAPMLFGLETDAMPHLGASLGNVFTDAIAGATLRVGEDLPADYGAPRIRPSLPGSDFFIPTQTWGWYLFAGAEARLVGRNIFLDGNTFRDSHSVDKEPLVGGLQAGITVTYGDTRLTYTHVFLTREFEQQHRPAQFGALSLSWRF